MFRIPDPYRHKKLVLMNVKTLYDVCNKLNYHPENVIVVNELEDNKVIICERKSIEDAIGDLAKDEEKEQGNIR